MSNVNVVLCRGWNFHRSGKAISVAEKNYSVPASYFDEIVTSLFPKQNPITFWFNYNPKTDGEALYQKAKTDNKIVEEGEDL